jgi:hypothetical protein
MKGKGKRKGKEKGQKMEEAEKRKKMIKKINRGWILWSNIGRISDVHNFREILKEFDARGFLRTSTKFC